MALWQQGRRKGSGCLADRAVAALLTAKLQCHCSEGHSMKHSKYMCTLSEQLMLLRRLPDQLQSLHNCRIEWSTD